jgi:hypothetical protein
MAVTLNRLDQNFEAIEHTTQACGSIQWKTKLFIIVSKFHIYKKTFQQSNQWYKRIQNFVKQIE